MPNRQTHAEILLGLLNNLNKANVRLDQLVFGKPSPNTKDPEKGNTQLPIDSPKNSKYAGPIRVTYNRFDLTELFAQANIEHLELKVAQVDTIKQLVPSIADAYDFNLTPVDVIDAQIDYDADGESVFELRAHADSLFYTGSILVHLAPQEGDIPLSSIITVTVMNGFDAVVKDDPSQMNPQVEPA